MVKITPIRTEDVDLSKLKFEDAYILSKKWHDNLQSSGIVANEDGLVFMTFDDGYYWIDLETRSCRDEANAMGHCGTTNGDTLLSLRNRQQPHVTIAYEYDGYMLQIKGKGNTKPIDKFHKYIIELLCYPNVSSNVKIIENDNNYHVKGFRYEYKPEDDFKINDLSKDEIKYVYSKNPEIFNDNFSLKYFLFKEKMITQEELMKGNPYKDLIFKDGEIYFVLHEWSDITAYKKDRNHRDDWQIEILSGDADFYSGEKIDFDYHYHWDELSQGTYEKIKDKIKGIVINVTDENGDEYELEFNDENTIVSENDITIKLHDDEVSLGDILKDDDVEINGNGIDSSELDDIRSDLDWAYTSAQESADQSAAYGGIIDAIEDVIGKPAVDEKGHVIWDKEHDGMLMNINLALISDLSQTEEGEGSSSVLDLINNALPYLNDGADLIDVDVPYYGWHGDITSEDLSSAIESRLY